MYQVKIIRIDSEPDHGTFGVMLMNGVAKFCTLEPYSRFNEKSISCIPTGQYICKRYSSVKYPNTFEVKNVQGRSNILFHKGNEDTHTEGCILIGQYFSKLKENRIIANSGQSFNEFLQELNSMQEFRLTVTEAY
jgi:DNA/RNA endonuclease YhcR with UshA esterase domain